MGLCHGTCMQMEPGLFPNLKEVQVASNSARATLAGRLDSHRTPRYLQEVSEHLPPDMLYGHSHQCIPQSPSFSTLEARSIQSHVRHEGRRRSKNRWTDRQSSHEYSCCGNRITCRFRLRQCLYSRSGALEQQGLAGGAWH